MPRPFSTTQPTNLPPSAPRKSPESLAQSRTARRAHHEALLFSVAEPPVDRAEHVGIIVGPDSLVLTSLGQIPFVGSRQLADIALLTRRDHDRGCEDVFIVAVRVLAVDPALQIVGLGDTDDHA